MTASPNPKDAYGKRKPGVSKVPASSLLHLGMAMENGARKYGAFNWRDHPVLCSVYHDAAFRHLLCYFEGEDTDQDSGLHHLGHVMACCAIILDAEEQGTLKDDRPDPKTPLHDMIRECTSSGSKADAEDKSVQVDDLATLMQQRMADIMEHATKYHFGGYAAGGEVSEKGPEAVFSFREDEEKVYHRDLPDVRVRFNITYEGLKEKVQDFLNGHDLRRAEYLKRRTLYNAVLDYMGNSLIEAYSLPQRSQAAFYLDCLEKGYDLSFEEMDEAYAEIARLTELGFL